MRLWSWRRETREAELDEELRTHIDMATQARVERGVNQKVAEGSARLEFGNVEMVKEAARDQWGRRWVEELPPSASHRSPLPGGLYGCLLWSGPSPRVNKTTLGQILGRNLEGIIWRNRYRSFDLRLRFPSANTGCVGRLLHCRAPRHTRGSLDRLTVRMRQEKRGKISLKFWSLQESPT